MYIYANFKIIMTFISERGGFNFIIFASLAIRTSKLSVPHMAETHISADELLVK
jgi:hypothetical protein